MIKLLQLHTGKLIYYRRFLGSKEVSPLSIMLSSVCGLPWLYSSSFVIHRDFATASVVFVQLFLSEMKQNFTKYVSLILTFTKCNSRSQNLQLFICFTLVILWKLGLIDHSICTCVFLQSPLTFQFTDEYHRIVSNVLDFCRFSEDWQLGREERCHQSCRLQKPVLLSWVCVAPENLCGRGLL